MNILQKHALICMEVGMKFVGHKVGIFTILPFKGAVYLIYLEKVGKISQILPSTKHIILVPGGVE